MSYRKLKKIIKIFKHWHTDIAKNNKRGVEMIEQPKVNFLFEIYNNVLQFVNQNLGWDLPEHASGAINLWFDDKDVMIDVETSDGGVSTISYTKFLEKLEDGKSKDPNYKLSKDDFCDCFQ